jgi:DNA-binding PadR family transcriptional regulator
MSIPQTLLGLLDVEPQHGYNLKLRYDSLFGGGRNLKFGQVYSTLARLERDNLVRVVATETADGPERKLYALTKSGVSELEAWLSTPLGTSEHSPGELYAKVTLALLTGRSADEILDQQRSIYLTRLRELVEIRRNGDISEQLASDYESAHLKADLDWIEKAGKRLEAWATALGEGQV